MLILPASGLGSAPGSGAHESCIFVEPISRVSNAGIGHISRMASSAEACVLPIHTHETKYTQNKPVTIRHTPQDHISLDIVDLLGSIDLRFLSTRINLYRKSYRREWRGSLLTLYKALAERPLTAELPHIHVLENLRSLLCTANKPNLRPRHQVQIFLRH